MKICATTGCGGLFTARGRRTLCDACKAQKPALSKPSQPQSQSQPSATASSSATAPPSNAVLRDELLAAVGSVLSAHFLPALSANKQQQVLSVILDDQPSLREIHLLLQTIEKKTDNVSRQCSRSAFSSRPTPPFTPPHAPSPSRPVRLPPPPLLLPPPPPMLIDAQHSHIPVAARYAQNDFHRVRPSFADVLRRESMQHAPTTGLLTNYRPKFPGRQPTAKPKSVKPIPSQFDDCPFSERDFRRFEALNGNPFSAADQLRFQRGGQLNTPSRSYSTSNGYRFPPTPSGSRSTDFEQGRFLYRTPSHPKPPFSFVNTQQLLM